MATTVPAAGGVSARPWNERRVVVLKISRLVPSLQHSCSIVTGEKGHSRKGRHEE